MTGPAHKHYCPNCEQDWYCIYRECSRMGPRVCPRHDDFDYFRREEMKVTADQAMKDLMGGMFGDFTGSGVR